MRQSLHREKIKEHDRDLGIARTQTSTVSEHAHEIGHYPIWNEVRFIDLDPLWYKRRLKEAIHVGLHRNNINREGKIEIPEAWMPTIRIPTTTGERYNSGPLREQLLAGTMEGCTNHSRPLCYK